MPRRRDLLDLCVSLGGAVLLIAGLRRLGVTNPTTAALPLLLIVLWTATRSPLWVAVVCAVVTTISLNFFFMPPVGTLTIADPQNWVALLVFLIVGFVASQLSAVAQAQTREAIERRKELGQLFDLSRDVLLITERPDTLDTLATYIAHRFELPRVALCLPAGNGSWRLRQGGHAELIVDGSQLSLARANAETALEFDARERRYGSHRMVDDASGRRVVLVPLRLGTRIMGLLASSEGDLDAGTLDAIAGLAAIAIERTQLLSERKEAELVRQKADLASNLLASLGHDLRTPLTAIGVAVENLQRADLPAEKRHQQARLALSELTRLTQVFRDILDMARIDADALTVERDWVAPADIVDAAVTNLRPTLDDRQLEIDADASRVVFVDPRLTSAALSHLLENAVQYSPAHSMIELRGSVDVEGLRLVVRDHGPGLDLHELDRLFERFYRGRLTSSQSLGTGMGLAIARGLLAAEGGRVWGENADGGGAQFTISVPAGSHAVKVVAE